MNFSLKSIPQENEQIDPSKFWQKWGLITLLFFATLLFSADLFSFSLHSLDDCFFARKGIEMERSENFFTVTWNNRPNYQNPPLQFWLLGLSFSLFGENDFAARIPFILMALGILLGTYRIACLTVGKNCALLSVALLMATPFFYENAQRCMFEVPLTFWVTMAMFIFIEGLKKPRLNLMLAMPLAAAILTKSLLGLLPIFIIVGYGLYTFQMRRLWSSGWLWGGILLGLTLGASWTIHQGLTTGSEALNIHYVREILNKSNKETLTIYRYLTNYFFDSTLWGAFQPIIFPAFVSLVQSIRDRIKGKTSGMDLLTIWAILPILLYSFTSTDRYIFPIITPVTILAGCFITRFLSRLAFPLLYFVLVFCLGITLLFWFWPQIVAENSGGFLRFPDNANQVFKDQKQVFRPYWPESKIIPYVGKKDERYWYAANPFLYYWEIYLDPFEGNVTDAVLKLNSTKSGSLVCNREVFFKLKGAGVYFKLLAEGKGWFWLFFPQPSQKFQG